MSLSSRVLKECVPPHSDCRVVRHAKGNGSQGSGDDEDREAAEARLELIRRQADSLLSEARSEATRILTQAKAEAVSIAEQAEHEGYDRGLARGLEEGRQQGEEQTLEASRRAVAHLLDLAHAAEEEQFRLLADVERQLVELALAIAGKVVGAELATRPQLLLDILARAIEEAHGSGKRSIHLHPQDVELVRPYLPQAALDAGGSQWRLVADDSLSPGDCLIETDFGMVDARISTQLAELSQLLLGDNTDSHDRD